MLVRALIGYFFLWKRNGWFIEMVHADVIVGDIFMLASESFFSLLSASET